jgi:hypothetical protein
MHKIMTGNVLTKDEMKRKQPGKKKLARDLAMYWADLVS